MTVTHIYTPINRCCRICQPGGLPNGVMVRRCKHGRIAQAS